ncbi:MAG TPA: DsbA family protein [Caulobacteraceae bacterium]|nr:DsbA family protein [Caulobacteraceae bacterium]
MRLLDRRLFVALGAAFTLAACNGGGGSAGAATSEDMTLGNADAKVTVVEYASAACSHCATWNEEVWPAFKAKYVDTGRVHYVFKEFLTPPIDLAAAAFLTARCAGEDKYFGVIDAVFRAQNTMFTTGDVRGELLRIANSAGLSEEEFNQCIRDEEALKALNERVERAQREDEITGTPTFLVNGKKVDGEASLEALDKAIAEAEAAAK